MTDKGSKDRLLVIPLADLHCGYRFGLMRPGVELPPLDEHQKAHRPRPTAFQTLIWRHFLSDAHYFAKVAGKNDVYILLMGDATQGQAFRDGMLVSARLSDQLHILEDAFDVLLKALPSVKGVRILKGTGTHTMGHGSTELMFAKHLRDAHGLEAAVHYHYRLNIRGVDMDLAHHGPPPGATPWIRGDALRRYTRAVMQEHLMAGCTPPKVVLRAHYHERVVEMVHVPTIDGKIHGTWAIVLPAYSLFVDDYTTRQTRGKEYMTVGSVGLEIEDGDVIRLHDRTHVIHVAKTENIR